MIFQNWSGDGQTLRRHLLPVCLLASAALHAAVAMVVTLPVPDDQPKPVSVLEVVLVQSEPPRSLPVEAQPPLPRSHAAARAPARRETVAAASSQGVDASPPLPASVESAAPEPIVTVPVAPEGRTAGAEVKADVASVASTPASFSAAYLSNPAPGYPPESRRVGEQGTVTLRVLVARDGRPKRVDMEKSSGSARLDAAALEAVKGWRFVPARRGTEAIESWVLVPVVFRLQGVS